MPRSARPAPSSAIATLALFLWPALVSPQPPPAPPFHVEEAAIADIHAALKGGRITCRGLVQQYLRRIDAYDKNGPALNAIVVTNTGVLAQADALDARFARSGPAGPLHCIPVIVKDNFETIGLQSAAGSLALEGFVSAKDTRHRRPPPSTPPLR